jgi:hypothetical protein
LRIRRAWWLARVAFHDWMWNQDSERKVPMARDLMQKLPLYFSDPYYVSDEEFSRIFTSRAEPVTGNRCIGTTTFFNVTSTSDLFRFQEF